MLLELEKQLKEYFAKERKEFTLPITLVGTPFQEEVWKVLQTIPYGEIRTYKEQAIAVGNPKGVRAVKIVFLLLYLVTVWLAVMVRSQVMQVVLAERSFCSI